MKSTYSSITRPRTYGEDNKTLHDCWMAPMSSAEHELAHHIKELLAELKRIRNEEF